MTQTAIIDTATRIIKRLTTDTPSFDPTTETAIPLATPITSMPQISVLGLDNITLTPATVLQIQQAGLDEAFNHQQKVNNYNAYKTALQTQINTPSPANLKALFQAMDKIL